MKGEQPMEINGVTIETIDAYIATFPPDVQDKMHALRDLIRRLVPEASEKISWQMPTFYLKGNLIHFAGFNRHIGLYPGPEAIEVFEDELKERKLKYSKGAVQFPLVAPVPFDLVEKIVLLNVDRNRAQKS